MDSFSLGADVETYGLATEFSTVTASSQGMAFEVSMNKPRFVAPPLRFNSAANGGAGGMLTLMHRVHEWPCEEQRTSSMVAEAKAKAKMHNELVAEIHQAHAAAVAREGKKPSLHEEHHMHTPIQLKDGGKLLYTSVPCKYHGSAKGCSHGEDCMYSHSDPHHIAPCKFLAAGECDHGGDCFFRHFDLHIPQVHLAPHGGEAPSHMEQAPWLKSSASVPLTPTTAPHSPPRSPLQEGMQHKGHEHHMHTPILLKDGGKLLFTSVPCKYFGSAAGCSHGEDCVYSHSDPHHVAPCMYFADGSCDHGHECFFRHTDMDVPQVIHNLCA